MGEGRLAAIGSALIVLLAAASRAVAYDACTAAEVIAHDPGCPAGSGACTLTLPLTAPGASCVFDFGARKLVVGASGSPVTIEGQDSLTLHAGEIQVLSGLVTARSVTLISLADVAVTAAPGGGRIRASVAKLAIRAGGAVLIAGTLDAIGDAGEISIAARSIQVAKKGSLDASAASASAIGGTVYLEADELVDLQGSLVFDGGEYAGAAEIHGDQVHLAGPVHGTATGDGAEGGLLEITAARDIEIGTVSLRGNGAYTENGGVGGELCARALGGSITLSGVVDLGDTASASDPDLGGGQGGEATLEARGDITIKAGAGLRIRGESALDYGGEVLLDSDRNVSIAGEINASGGVQGGSIYVNSAGALDVSAPIRARAESNGGVGGYILLGAGRPTGTSGEAVVPTVGSVTLGANLDVRALGCQAERGCGHAGLVRLDGCDVSSTAASLMQARGQTIGGLVTVTARHAVSLAGGIDAGIVDASGVPGNINFIASGPLAGITGSLTPAPHWLTLPLCASLRTADCLVPCPTCGNGTIEFPETCDDSGALSCDGCDAHCRLETSCDDHVPCTTDYCDAVLGCLADNPTTRFALGAECGGDCDHDGHVGPGDIHLLTSFLTLCQGDVEACTAPRLAECSCASADLDQSGRVTAGELTQIESSIGACP